MLDPRRQGDLNRLFVAAAVGLALFLPFGVAERGDWVGLLVAMPILGVKLALGGFLLALS